MQRLSLALLLLICLLLEAPRQGYAQTAQSVFGRNRIQYDQEQWQYLVSNHFDVYYGKGSEEYARRCILVAEQEYIRITELIGYSPYNRIRFYLYDSPLRLAGSNVGLETSSTVLGGKTSFIKSIIEIAYSRSQATLKRDIAKGLARSMVYDMMYGGSFTEAVQNSYLMMLPEWFTEGAIAYAADGWSLELDNWARDEAEAGRMRRLNVRQGTESERLGQSFWAFLAERYGRANVSNILNLTRIIRNEESAISSTLGIPYSKVLREWRSSYVALADQTRQVLSPLPDDKILRIRIHPDDEIFGIAISPSGRFAAWASQDAGRTRLGIKDLMTGRQRVLWRQGERHNDTKAVPMSPVAFVGSDKVATVYHRGSKMELIIFTVSGKKYARYPLADIDQVQHLAFSEDGKKGIVIGSDHGHTDIYQINPNSGKIRKLTDDLADESDPFIDKEGKYVYYASTQIKPSDTANASTAQRKYALRNRIYRLPLANKAVPELVAEGMGALQSPFIHPDLGLLGISDVSGALNLVQIGSGEEGEPVTGFATSLERVAFSSQAKRAIALVRYDGRSRLLKMDSLAPVGIKLLPETPWREVHPIRPPAEVDRYATNQQTPELNSQGPQDTLPKQPPAPIVQAPAAPVPQRAVDSAAEADPVVDIRRYVFEEERVGAVASKPLPVPGAITTTPISAGGTLGRSSLPTVQELRTGRKLLVKDVYSPPIIVSGPFPAGYRLSSNSVTTSLGIDPYRGWGLVMQASMSDYFENHRFQVMAQPFLDLQSSNLSADYQFLKHRIDFSAHFGRNSLFVVDNFAQKNFLHTYQLGASYPISRSFRVSYTTNVRQTNYYDLFENTRVGEKTRAYVGQKVEAMYDNSFTSSSNITTGTKMRLVVESNQGIRASERSFGSVMIDLRRYQRLHKEITLAVRASGGRFFGASKKQYMLGGMDNWFFNRFTPYGDNVKDNPIQNANLASEGHVDWFFNPFVTNLRGFDYNALYGNNFILLNAELRLPLVKYLYKGPIASNFLRNFQIVGFYDMGSAWTGSNLLGRENSINTKVTQNGPFTITTINTRSPFLIGYGLGVRTMMLGYYVKFDFALGQQDYSKLNKRLYLTFGYDF